MLLIASAFACVVGKAEMGVCGICELGVVVSDLPVVCIGRCKQVFHCTCTTLTRTQAKLITDNPNILFKCKNCLSDCVDEQDDLISHVKKIEEEMNTFGLGHWHAR